jgi:hypothetical protein
MKKHHQFSKAKFLFLIIPLLVWVSCKTENIKPVAESTKDITGTWRIVKATRNGSDLISLVDTANINFNAFNIIFKSGTYSLVNTLPFIVAQNGTYSLDNPQYPFVITFKQSGSSTGISTAFTYPIVNGVRVLTIVFSPGCPQNIYSYSLQKVN